MKFGKSPVGASPNRERPNITYLVRLALLKKSKGAMKFVISPVGASPNRECSIDPKIVRLAPEFAPADVIYNNIVFKD